MGMKMGYLDPLRMGMRFNFLYLLDMDKITDKYMIVGDGNGECKSVPTCSIVMSNLSLCYIVYCNQTYLFFSYEFISFELSYWSRQTAPKS